MALDVVFGKGLLEDLVVLDVFVLRLRLPFALVHRHIVVDGVNHLAVDCARRALLDFGEAQLGR